MDRICSCLFKLMEEIIFKLYISYAHRVSRIIPVSSSPQEVVLIPWHCLNYHNILNLLILKFLLQLPLHSFESLASLIEQMESAAPGFWTACWRRLLEALRE